MNLGPVFNTMTIYGREATLLSIHYHLDLPEIDNSETKTHTAY